MKLKLNSAKVFYLMIGLVGLAVILNLAAVIAGKSMLSSASSKLQSLKVDSEVLSNQQTALVKARRDIATYTDLDNIAKSIVPQDKDQAKAVREITGIASKLGIPIYNITFPNSTLGQNVPHTTGSGSTSNNSTSTTPKASSSSVTQVQAVPGLPGVYQIPINVQSDPNHAISFSQFINFLKGLELNRRTSQVSTINVTPSANHNLVIFSIIVNEYVKP